MSTLSLSLNGYLASISHRCLCVECLKQREILLSECGANVWMAAESSDYYIGSEPELLSSSFFSMSQVSYTVAVGVVFEDLGCLTSIEPLMFEGYDEHSLNLRNGQSRSFF